AIWSETGGQSSTIKWTGTTGSSGTISFKISDYKNNRGRYHIHVYNSTSTKLLTNTSFYVSTNTSATMSITSPNNDDKQFLVTMQFADMPTEVSAVQIPIWTTSNQSDIKWYTATNKGSGKWQFTLNVSDYKKVGTYTVHAYALLSNGSQKFLNSGSFSVSNVTGSVATSNYNQNAGTFDVTVSNISSKSGISVVQVPVWCKSDQSDIKWYTASKQTNGSYKVSVAIANHSYNLGTYTAHAYVTAGNGLFRNVGATTRSVTAPDITLTATGNTAQTSYSLVAGNPGVVGTVKSVSFAVWGAASGQNDIRWYSGTKNSSGGYTANAAISNHKEAGTYNVHCYATMSNGTLRFLKATTFTVTAATGSVSVSNYNKNAGTFVVTVSNLSAKSGVSTVQIPVWSKSNQSDIKWYTASKQTDGSYKTTVSIVNHSYNTGTYKAHVYVTAGNGVMNFVAGTTQAVTAPEVGLSVSDSSGTESRYALTASNVGLVGSVKGVSFAVWGAAGGQNDIKWYSGSLASSGNYTSTAVISNHKEVGTYNVHCYATMSNGSMRFLKSTTFTVSSTTASISLGSYNETTGKMTITVSNISSKSGVSNVIIPVWSTSNQSNITWYTASKQSNGSYTATMDIANHSYLTGTYKFHVYVTNGNGAQMFTGSTTKSITTVPYNVIAGTSSVTASQLVTLFKKYNTNYDTFTKYPNKQYDGILSKGGAATIEIFCAMYIEEAKAEGIRADIAFAQMMVETGFLQFGGQVAPNQYNFAGLGAVDGGAAGATLDSVRIGIRAQIQHLKCYANSEPLKNTNVDPRWSESLRNKAPYVEWLSIPNNPYGTGWASDSDYASKIMNYVSQL
ncbi:MAG: GBS Bsp-like repeat-containing protein, partial [Suipraeoptans sp.]